MDNVKPTLEVKSRRVGGSNYQVPIEVRPERRTSLSLRWLVSFARSRPEKTMVDKLAGELLDASSNRGGAVKKREDTHRMAEANKAFRALPLVTKVFLSFQHHRASAPRNSASTEPIAILYRGR